jgi:hypothetical protein
MPLVRERGGRGGRGLGRKGFERVEKLAGAVNVAVVDRRGLGSISRNRLVALERGEVPGFGGHRDVGGCKVKAARAVIETERFAEEITDVGMAQTLNSGEQRGVGDFDPGAVGNRLNRELDHGHSHSQASSFSSQNMIERLTISTNVIEFCLIAQILLRGKGIPNSSTVTLSAARLKTRGRTDRESHSLRFFWEVPNGFEQPMPRTIKKVEFTRDATRGSDQKS